MMIEDWEREAHKDFIYLQEQKILLEQELQEELYREEQRKPAIVVVLGNTTKPSPHESDILSLRTNPEEWV